MDKMKAMKEVVGKDPSFEVTSTAEKKSRHPEPDAIAESMRKTQAEMGLVMDELLALARQVGPEEEFFKEEAVAEYTPTPLSGLKKKIDLILERFKAEKNKVEEVKKKMRELSGGDSTNEKNKVVQTFNDIRMQAIRLELLIKEGKQASKNVKDLYAEMNSAWDYYKKHKLKELGAREDESPTSLYFRKSRESRREKGFLGIAQLWNSEKIQKIEKETRDAEEISYFYTPSLYRSDLVDNYTIDSTIEELGEQIKSIVEARLHEVSESLPKERSLHENPPHIFLPEQIGKLEGFYMETYIEPKLEEMRGSYTKEDLEIIRSYLRRSLTIPTSIYNSTTDDVRERIQMFRDEMDGLDSHLRHGVERIQPQHIISEEFQKAARFIEGVDGRERGYAAEAMVADFNTRCSKIGETRPDLRYLSTHFYVKRDDTRDASKLGIEEFKIIARDPECVERFGEGKITKAKEQMERMLEEQLYEKLRESDSENAKIIGLNLLKFGGTRNATVILLNYFRESFSNLVADGVENYAKSLTSDEMETLYDMQIPGLIELLDYFRAGGKVDISAIDLINKNLAQILEHQISLKDPKANSFLISTAEQVDGDMKDSYAFFMSIIDIETAAKIQRMAGQRMIKFGDIKSLELMQSAQDFFHSPVAESLGKNQVAYNRNDILKHFILFLDSKLEESLVGIDENERATARAGAMEILKTASEKGLFSDNDEEKILSIMLSGKTGADINIYQDYLTDMFSKLRYVDDGTWGVLRYLDERVSDGTLQPSHENVVRICSCIEQLACERDLGFIKPIKELFLKLNEKGFIDKEQYEKTAGIIRLMDRESMDEIKNTEVITDENWSLALLWYARADGGYNLGDEDRKKILGLFSNEHPDHRDLCLKKMGESWREFIKTGKLGMDGSVISKIANVYGGIGDLQYIDGISKLMFQVDKYASDPKAPKKTKDILLNGFRDQEVHFLKERWSEEDKSFFYVVSKDILSASPSLYTDYQELLSGLKPREMKMFVKEYFGIYQAMMVVLDKGQGKFDGRDLLPIRKQIREIAERIVKGEPAVEVFTEKKSIALEFLKSNFTKRFRLIKVPEEFSTENIRTLQNFIKYSANLYNKNKKSETVLALYMSLTLNNEWHAWRRGENIDIKSHLTREAVATLYELDGKNPLESIVSVDLGIQEEEKAEFMSILEDETVASKIGNVETIDLKLGKMKRMLTDLDDPDAYELEEDKKILQLYKQYGKYIGATLATLFKMSKGNGSLDEKGEEISRALASIYKIERWDEKSVKRIQEETKGASLVHGILKKIEEEDIDTGISALQEAVAPNDRIISIFMSLGEEFKTQSGALALSEDLSYLENIITKNKDKLGTEDNATLSEYIGGIRSRMKDLEEKQVRLKEYFETLNKSIHGSNKTRLKERLSEIKKVIDSNQESINIVSRVTGDLNAVIENIRQCLGCLSSQCNNDTNLTFGESYKFLALSQNGEQKASIADQLVMFLPAEFPDGKNGYTFVLDNVYGSKSSDVLMAHVNVVYKKLSAIKKRFPDARASITVTNVALSSVGLSEELFLKRCVEEFPQASVVPISEVSLAIPTSKLGDNYSEFTRGTVRPVGAHIVEGVVMSTKP